MKLKSNVVIILFVFIAINVQAIVPERKGWWKFDTESDLTIAEQGFGENLTLVGSHIAASGPESGNGATKIGVGSYYKMNHLIPANGGGSKVNEYTLQYDFKVEENGVWRTFFQTVSTNSDDGEFFINPSGNIGVGAVGYSSYILKENEWYRLLIAVKNPNLFIVYLDGNLLITGNPQLLDSRFSLDKILLVFADNDAEDGTIICSELAIWDQYLSKEQAMELGGYGHKAIPYLMTRIPYLQGQGQNTMHISWHDTAQTNTKVIYGLDSSLLDFSETGTNEIISDPYRWHTVKLKGLQPHTRYFYKVASGSEMSPAYSFKTLPDINYTGKIRFVLLSDTHSFDSTAVGKVMRAAKAKITELYGPDIENHVNGIFHSGDITVSGNVPEQYTTQFFRPLAVLSPYLPSMVVAGNHEGENLFFYQYLKLDDQSGYPNNEALNEKIWHLKIGNSLFIGLNTNITEQYGITEANWLDSKLNEAENDPTTDIVFIFLHHTPISELWGETDTWEGSKYVISNLYPIIKKYSKVQQINSGHTHGFERGTILSNQPDADFRAICGGGGGGAIDRWGSYINNDYHDIHVALDNYCFQILEIDIANHSYENTLFSLGNESKPRNSEALDTWYKKKNQPGPETPIAGNVVISDGYVQFNSSEFVGVDSIMTVRVQVTDSSNNAIVVLDTLIHWKNIYKADNAFNPIDKNKGINLYQTNVKTAFFVINKTYSFRVSYRDHNLKWSSWSNESYFKKTATSIDMDYKKINYLKQNFPNPFKIDTQIEYHLSEKSPVFFRVLNAQNQLVASSNEGLKEIGPHLLLFDANNLEPGVYYYQLITSDNAMTKEMIKIN